MALGAHLRHAPSRADTVRGGLALLRATPTTHLTVVFCTLVVLGFLLTSDAMLHWFIVPVLLCGLLIAGDAVDWVRGHYALFDPFGMVGLIGTHFFFLAPLLHVTRDFWMSALLPPDDWRPWLGGMALLNACGLLIYRTVRRQATDRLKPPAETMWQLDLSRLAVVLPIALIGAAAAQLLVYRQMGGIVGYIIAYTLRRASGIYADPFEGMGAMFMISEAFPILLLIGYAAIASKREAWRSWVVVTIVMVLFFASKMLFGGLRGSRSNTIWGLFWAAGVIHLWVRAIPRKLVMLGIGFIILFLYAYGFYKGAGIDAMQAMESAETRQSLADSTHRTLDFMILNDLGRSDIQALILYRLCTPERDFQYAYGRTYVGAVSLLVPQSIWPQRIEHKSKEGTEIQYGEGSYIPGVLSSSRLYGLAGEAMLNFGPLGVPVLFALFGFGMRRLRLGMLSLRAMDSRLLFVPLLINLCFLALVADSDNVLYCLFKNGALPMFVVAICSRRVRVPAALPETNSAP